MNRSLLFLLILITFSALSCSAGPLNPVVGGEKLNGNPDSPLAYRQDLNTVPDSIGILGQYDLSIDSDQLAANLEPVRSSSIGESFIVNGIGYFTISPCANCLKLKSVSLTTENLLQITFYIRHPFNPGDPFKPPSGINRLDLDIFDVALLVHPQGTAASTYTLTGASAYTGVLANNAGYTTELSNVIDDTAALPYVLIVDDNTAGTSTFNEFPMGTESQFYAFFNLTGNLNFKLYLTMGYGASAKKAQRLNPVYYNPEFNRKSAWKVVVTPPNGNDLPMMGNTWNDIDATTPYNVTVGVFDWQIGANVDPALANTSDVYASSEVSSVSVEIPGMNNSLISQTAPASGTGTPSDPLVYILPVPNTNRLAAGIYTGLVKVADERVPGIVAFGGETDTMADSPNGISLNWVNIPEFATYQAFTATVVIGCGPVTGSITSPSCPVTGVANGSNLDFSAQASSGNGGDPVVLYEWDMDYDGIPSHFTVDATGPDVTLGPFTNPNCGIPPEDPVTYTVAVRGTDSCSTPNVMVFATCEVTVDLCIAPSVGNIILTVNRLGLAARQALDDSGPFTISWEDPGAGYVEYAVYVDTDPSDGITNNLGLAGTTTGLSFTDTNTTVPINHYIVGWTYIVRGRTVAGNPSSEGQDSEPAYVTFNGWETVALPQSSPYRANPGIGNDGEGWLVNHETSFTPDISWPTCPRGDDDIPMDWIAQGTITCQFSPFCGSYWLTYGASAGRWQGITKETPVVADSSVRFVEYSLRIFQVYLNNGLILGTIASQPPIHNFSNTQDFIWSQASSSNPHSGYNNNASYPPTVYGNVPNNQNNTWANQGNSSGAPYLLVGGDVNTNGHADHPYVGIQLAVDTQGSWGSQPYPLIDEVAIVIY